MAMGFGDVWTQGHVDSGMWGHGDLRCDQLKNQIFWLNELSHKPDHSTLVKYNFGCVKKVLSSGE